MKINGFDVNKYDPEYRRLLTVKQLYKLFLGNRPNVLEQCKEQGLIEDQVAYLRKLAGEDQ